EGWTELLYIQMRGCDVHGYDGMAALCTSPQAAPATAVVFFVSFILIGTMIVLNLFIGVITNSMAEAQAESEQAAFDSGEAEAQSLEAELEDVQRQLAALTERMGVLTRRLSIEQASRSNAAPSNDGGAGKLAIGS